MESLNQDTLKELLDYNPETGLFTWKITKRGVKSGSTSGGEKQDGYIRIMINGKYYRAHRLAWLYIYNQWPKDQIDHINHVRDDNRLCNLREATMKENGKNQSIKINNKSGFNGVSWDNKYNKWRATIHVGVKTQHLGYFNDLQEAIAARVKANEVYAFHINHGNI